MRSPLRAEAVKPMDGISTFSTMATTVTVAVTVANCAAICRLDGGANKYVLWAPVPVAMVLPALCERAAWDGWLLLCSASVVWLAVSAWKRGLV